MQPGAGSLWWHDRQCCRVLRQLLTAGCCRGDQWLSYDNERSIRVKTEYAWDEGLAGVMTWSIDTDDFRGDCNGPKFPLLR